MSIGSKKEDANRTKSLDIQGEGQSAGMPAAGEMDASSYSPLGEKPGLQHWQQSYITKPGLNDRSNVFFAAIEMTRMPMLVSDANQPDTPIVFVNRAFLDLTGYTEEQVLGRNCRFLQGEDTDPRTVDEIRSAIKEERAIAVDILNYKVDGTPFWNALFIGPIFDEHGKLLYFFASQLDITRRRQSEQSFRQAQKMEAIGQLTAGLAHDFNNLLQVVVGNLEVAATRVGNDAILKDAIFNAEQAATKGGKLTQQLLMFARKQRLEPKVVSLNSVILEFSEMLTRTLGDNIDLRMDLKSGLPTCTIDPIHFEMALLNVLINARDAMPHGGKITIGTSVIQDKAAIEKYHLQTGKYVEICIHDQGAGMPPNVLRQATEPFFTTKGVGTGLGLAMVHGFVQQSHGHLEIESEANKGTTVRMIFPVSTERVALAGSKPIEAPDLIASDESEVKTILLVEDSEDVRHIAVTHLRSLGYRVLAAHSGEAALEMLDTVKTVDLLFTDVMMPGGMNGLVLAERVRERLPDLPILLATGYTEDLVHQGGNVHHLSILSKPYRSSELAKQVRIALNQNGNFASPNAGNFQHEG